LAWLSAADEPAMLVLSSGTAPFFLHLSSYGAGDRAARFYYISSMA
jgi:hypothetical protein